ncbi:hypothetical protein [uncultured Corynebacterium sp.]|uniref:hypothetical protein n=1 Tax=uncultured Corynebacterium sp. TaxID=159447 RepID=UPI0025EA7A13|nr:hypothetical protein [uncultured Corynebacterium sp.]
MKRVAASVFLIFFGFAVTACGSAGDERALSGAFADTEELSTSKAPVDNPDSGEAQEDGRVLKPEGHEGMWFETEPTDPWEHYVWESQKFVGDPIELPKLEGNSPNDPLAGLPDVCDEKVIERMKEVGFEHQSIDDDGLYYGCHFVEINPVAGGFKAELFSLVLDPGRSIDDFKKEVNFQSSRDDVNLIGITKNAHDNECAVAQEVKNTTFYSMNGVLDAEKPTDEVCMLSDAFFQIFDNIS